MMEFLNKLLDLFRKNKELKQESSGHVNVMPSGVASNVTTTVNINQPPKTIESEFVLSDKHKNLLLMIKESDLQQILCALLLQVEKSTYIIPPNKNLPYLEYCGIVKDLVEFDYLIRVRHDLYELTYKGRNFNEDKI